MGARKIAVTGASGFIGRYVLAELARQQVDVVAVTRDAARLAGAGLPGRLVEMASSVELLCRSIRKIEEFVPIFRFIAPTSGHNGFSPFVKDIL